MFQITIGEALHCAFPWKDLFQVSGGLLAFLGVILTIAYTGKRQRESFDRTARLQREADARRLQTELDLRESALTHDVRVARGVLFAQLSRVYRTIQGEYEYLATSELPFIWIAFYNTLLPTPEALKRAELLSVEEVVDVTAFYYSYHENMGYIAAASGGEGKTMLKLDCHLVGLDVRAADRQLKWLMDALGVIERKALAAMRRILAAAEQDYGGEGEVAQKFQEEEKRNARLAKRSEPHRATLEQRIATATHK